MTNSWEEPVKLVFADSGTVLVTGPREALEYLLYIWPTSQTELYAKCKETCMEAIEGVTPVEEARSVFERAAREARLLS
ncbi:DUF982 domain-containing protein [Rhizobium sp. LjRoot98]|uniref:DUF982 domain-containing protein n=1 Tax=unclassified Rhizobium TaxID=2613769 RepID=UPI00138F83BC|nr:DUF982 domain-containing protein [Rhizobium sp. Root1204]